jgi:hypothetical protein
MNLDQIQAEQEAYESMTGLLDQARKCQQLHERAGLPLPERVQRLLGVVSPNGVGKGGATVRAASHISVLSFPNAPKQANHEWVSIDIKDSQPSNLILATLRENGAPMRARDLTAKVTAIDPAVLSGTIANAGTRLQAEGLIDRGDDGWKLLKQEHAGLISGGRLWGLPTIFGKQELAAHRREAILHVLKHFPTGLQTVQIVEQLHGCTWMRAPANKDLLKADLQLFAQEKKIRRGSSKKWLLVA